MTNQRSGRKICLSGVRFIVAACLVTAAMSITSPARASAATDTSIIIDWKSTSEFVLYFRDWEVAPSWVTWIDDALVMGAVYDATNGITRSHQAYVAIPPSADPHDSVGAAGATAAYRMLLSIAPEAQPTLDSAYQETLSSIPDGAAKSGGIQVGEEAASAMLAARQNDGRNAEDLTYRVVYEPGQFRPIPPNYQLDPNAWVKDVTPFLLSRNAQFRPPAPNPLTSAAYAADVNEVKSVGSQTSTTRTPEQLDIGRYWENMPFVSILSQLAQRQGLDGPTTARLFAMMSLARADGIIAQADGKYFWNLWRPVTAIREADTDGNPATEADPNWLPWEDQSTLGGVFNGGAGAEYPAGHPTVAGAIVRTLQSFFGSDSIPGGALSAFSFSSDSTRTFTSFSQIDQEVIDARTYVGVHYRSSSNVGTDVGHKIADYGFGNYFQRCDRTVAGTYKGSLSVTAGVTCLAPGANVTGSVAVSGGASLVADNATVGGPFGATGAAGVHLRKVSVGGPMSIRGATNRVFLSRTNVGSSVVLTDNRTGQTPIVVSGNHIGGSLACSGNQPPPVNDGVLNTVKGSKLGQCSAL